MVPKIIVNEHNLVEEVLNHPIPDIPNMVFFIQRNNSLNTVVYELNFNINGQLIYDFPLKVYWKKYSEGGKTSKLNYMQNKLAYGYTSEVINTDLIVFQFVSYPKRFFIVKNEKDDFEVITKINGANARVNKIFVDVEDLGAFPSVKFVDIIGCSQEIKTDVSERILFG